MTLPPDDAQPDAAFYERMRLRGQSRSSGVSHAAIDAASHVETAPAAPGETVHAWQRVGRALGDVAGHVLGKVQWQRGRVYNPKILAADIKPPKRKVPPPTNWARDVTEAFAGARIINVDVSVPYFSAVVHQIEKIASDGAGCVKRAYKSIGRLAGMGRKGMEGNWGRETVRKVIDWCREHGWLGPLNSLYRDPENRALKRDANVYLLFAKEDAAEISAIEDPSARALKRESLTLSRGAVLWGLAVRPWGLNATPSPSNRHQIRTHPAPA